MPIYYSIKSEDITISIPPFFENKKVRIKWNKDIVTKQDHVIAHIDNLVFDGSLQKYLKYFNKADSVPDFFYCNHNQKINSITTVAKCSPEDVFDYEKGKKIALMRLKRNILFQILDHYNKMLKDLEKAYNVIRSRAYVKIANNINSTTDYINELTK